MSSIMPTPDVIQKLAQAPDTGKVVMLNLLKFKPGTGAASYNEYGRHVGQILEEDRGARAIRRPGRTVVDWQRWRLGRNRDC